MRVAQELRLCPEGCHSAAGPATVGDAEETRWSLVGYLIPYSVLQVRWRSRQNGVVRYNCADSLDRTNAASYFGAVQVQCSPHCQSTNLSIRMFDHKRGVCRDNSAASNEGWLTCML